MRRRQIVLVSCAGVLALGAIGLRSLPRRGVIENESKHQLWVVETDSGRAVAHLLAPGRRSPHTVDADGVRCENGAPIDAHGSWWKARDISVARVGEDDGVLSLSCLFCTRVQDDEFGTSVRFDRSAGWGEPLP